MQAKPPRPVLNRAHPLARGLRAAWPFGIVRGIRPFVDVAQKQGASNLTGSTTVVGGVGSGGSCVVFDSDATAYLEPFTPPSMGVREPYSLYADVEMDPATARSSVLIGWSNTTSSRAQLWWIAGGYDAFQHFRSDGLTAAGPYVGGYLKSTRYRVCGTYDGTNVRLYVNGSLVAGPTAHATSVTTSTFRVGGEAITPYQYAHYGKLYDARVWMRCLSSEEVNEMYDDPWALYRPQRVSFLRPGMASATFPWLSTVLSRANRSAR